MCGLFPGRTPRRRVQSRLQQPWPYFEATGDTYCGCLCHAHKCVDYVLVVVLLFIKMRRGDQNARMGRVNRNGTKAGGRPFSHGRGGSLSVW